MNWSRLSKSFSFFLNPIYSLLSPVPISQPDCIYVLVAGDRVAWSIMLKHCLLPPPHDCWFGSIIASSYHRRARRLLVQLKLKNAPCISTADHWPAQLDGYWLDRQHRTSLHVCHGQQRGSSWRAGMARPPDLAIVVGASKAYIEMDFHASKSTRPATSWWCCEDEQSYPGGTCRHYGEREAGHRRFSFRLLCCM